MTFDALLTAIAGWLLAACAGWTVLLCLAAALESVTDGRLRATRWVACPPSLRRTLLPVLGLALASGVSAAPVAARAPGSGESLPVPTRPLGGAPEHSVEVRPGDSLWRIAAAHLPPRAEAAAVAREVERLHRVNRRVIGADPDVIRPGQHLRLPRRP